MHPLAPERALAALALASCLARVEAATITLSPPPGCTDTEQLETVANALAPGDELILRGGVYCQTGRRLIDARGTAAAPIVIRAATGETPVLTRPDDPAGPQTQNGTEVYGEYLVLRGLRFERGDAGLRMLGGHHVTIEDCEIANTSNNGLTLNTGNTDAFVIRRNHIHHTGLLDGAFGTTEGEGMYIGIDAAVRASHHLVEGNYIHHLRGTSSGGNDGIEIKYGSWGNVVRNNVIHDTTIGTDYPCIFVYGVRDVDVGAPNVVEGNALWNCGEAIQVGSDAIVRNNLMLDSLTGITAAPHAQVPVLRNVSIVHNTIHGHAWAGMYVRWTGATGMLVANNAIYNPGGVAVDERGLGGAGIVVRANRVEGSGVTLDGVRFLGGGSANQAFLDPLARSFWPRPGSLLAGRADPAFLAPLDFNGTPRGLPADVGAYQSEGLRINPGWPVGPGFKPATGTTALRLWFGAADDTLRFSAVAVAERYDVYRGRLADLADANGDGAPDGGYGECRSASDSDLTDTVFVDREIPVSGGFFYLVSFDAGGDSSGLGWSSAGRIREPLSPCP